MSKVMLYFLCLKSAFKIRNALNIVGIVEKSENIICSICSEIPAEIETPCKHSFCKNCISKWIEMGKMICPYCRQSMENKFNQILI